MAHPALLVRGLTKRLGKAGGRSRGRAGGQAAEPIAANHGIDLEVARGEVVGLLGPNGAGKTTAVRQIVGLLRPDAGSISMLGHDVLADPTIPGRAAAYLAQTEPALEDMPVSLAIETTARMRGLSRRAAVQARDSVIDELALGPIADRPLLKLSGGQRRLAAFGAVLVGDRALLVLDEPTTGLDPEARRAVWAAIEARRARNGTAVLLVTHNVLEAETFLDRVAVLDAGRVIAFDTPGRLKASVSDEVRLDLVWRGAPPLAEPGLRTLAAKATITGRRWSVRLPTEEARALLGTVTAGPAFAALDDFTLATPSLEDVYLSLGGQARDLERA